MLALRKSPAALIDRAAIYLAEGDLNRAIAGYTAAIALAATSNAIQPGSHFMASHSSFLSFSKLESFLFCAALVCVLACAQAFAKGDRLAKCRTGDPDSRIAACSEVIERGSREAMRNQLAALINRAAALRAKGDLDQALVDLDKALRPKCRGKGGNQG
jgi:tetratricopeptide (TPR) repeat protein